MTLPQHPPQPLPRPMPNPRKDALRLPLRHGLDQPRLQDLHQRIIRPNPLRRPPATRIPRVRAPAASQTHNGDRCSNATIPAEPALHKNTRSTSSATTRSPPSPQKSIPQTPSPASTPRQSSTAASHGSPAPPPPICPKDRSPPPPAPATPQGHPEARDHPPQSASARPRCSSHHLTKPPLSPAATPSPPPPRPSTAPGPLIQANPTLSVDKQKCALASARIRSPA